MLLMVVIEMDQAVVKHHLRQEIPTSRYALTTNNESITGFPNTIGTLSISYE